MQIIHNITKNYRAENAGVRAKIWQLLHHGALSGTGHLLIYPIDQGFEHGPDRSFLPNPPAYDPEYHLQFAIDNGFSALAAPIGFLENLSASSLWGQIPMILKINSSNALYKEKNPETVVYSSIKKALQLGCIGIGITIYPGSARFHQMLPEIKTLIQKAKNAGLLVVIWSYPRGENLTAKDETALDVISYATHITALLGAHIIKVKLPSEYIFDTKNLDITKMENDSREKRVRHVVRSAFAGKRMVIFSGGKHKMKDELTSEINAIKEGGGTGSIIGRNVFQRTQEDAQNLVKNILDVYRK